MVSLSFPALDQAIQDGAILFFARDVRDSRLVRIWSEPANHDIAMGVGETLSDALRAAEQDLLSECPLASRVSECECWTCAMNALAPAVVGRAEPESALDRHEFTVRTAGGRFVLVADWVRRADQIGREVSLAIRDGGVPSRWQHGEFIWEYVPFKGTKTGKSMMSIRPVVRPAGSNFHCPREKRRVEADADSLAAVLATAEVLLAAADHEDGVWLAQTRRCD